MISRISFTAIMITLIYLSTGHMMAQKTFDADKTNGATAVKSFKEGEFLKFRIHYGVVNAGFATLKLQTATRNGKELYHAVGKGWTSGATKFFFEVDDLYESYFTKGDLKPVFHKRRVDEGGYLIRRDKYFDYDAKTVTVDDLQKNTKKQYPIQNVQDMISALYFMRNIDISQIKQGEEISVNLFFDGETFPFKLRFINKEVIRTKFGKVNTWRVQPMVQKGRVFEDKESLTIWITNDANKIPIRFKAQLVVGSLKADLDTYSGLSNSFPIIVE